MVARPRLSRILAAPLAAVLLGGVLAAAPVGAAPIVSCTMQVSVNLKSTQTYANGVQRNVYSVKVSHNGSSQSATVQRMVMPVGAKPRLVTMRLGALAQLRSQLDSKKGVRGIAAVNGDFFYGYRIDGQTVYLPRDGAVSHGRVVRASSVGTRVVGFDIHGAPVDSVLGVTGSVTHGSSVFPVTGINWENVPDAGVGVYTSAWADVTTARRPATSVEWVVKKGVITVVRTGPAVGSTVAPRTRVLAFGRNYAGAAKRAKVGSAVKVVTQQVTSNGVPMREAVGRGLALLRGGAVPFACAPTLNQDRPRTTVGWTASGQWMTLSLPGTGYDRYGLRIGGLGLAQEANVAKALGFSGAVELDGGGSTTAFVRRADKNWDRVDDADSAYQRQIPNAFVFVPAKH
ncbi:MAG: phosphodiester glycosidase family protein [Actinomycetes bacterium]